MGALEIGFLLELSRLLAQLTLQLFTAGQGLIVQKGVEFNFGLKGAQFLDSPLLQLGFRVREEGAVRGEAEK